MNSTELKLHGGYGYWQTDFYPIGGCFRRAPESGKSIAAVLRTFPRYKGVNTEVRFSDGTRGAVDSAHIERKGGAE